MKKEITEVAYLTVDAKTRQPFEIRIQAKWCLIDWGDYSFGCGLRSERSYEKKGKYKITITAEELQEVSVIGSNCMFADFSGCKHLKRLYIDGTGLKSIELHGCKELKLLSCGNNQLTTLDLFDLPKLHRLECSHNYLQSLILRRTCAISHISCNDNQLNELKIPGKNSLVYLDCSDNLLSEESLKKVFSRLFCYLPERKAKISCERNPGFPSCNTRKIIDKGWRIKGYKDNAA